MIANWELIARLVLAAVLGSVIGFERERLAWAAGLRTHMLVCVGSALFMLVSAFGFGDVLGTPHVVLDPSRVAAQVVSGVGFLGAGSILLRGEIVRGLTTAASLWSVAAVGLAVGGGLYTAAIAAVVIVLVILAGIKPLERRFRISQKREISLLTERGQMTLAVLHAALGARAGRVLQFVVQQSEMSDVDNVSVVFSRMSTREFESIIKDLRALAVIREVKLDNAAE
ncbi:MAG: MgtC/SapB family protein [Janthinobacterium lividum]